MSQKEGLEILNCARGVRLRADPAHVATSKPPVYTGRIRVIVVVDRQYLPSAIYTHQFQLNITDKLRH